MNQMSAMFGAVYAVGSGLFDAPCDQQGADEVEQAADTGYTDPEPADTQGYLTSDGSLTYTGQRKVVEHATTELGTALALLQSVQQRLEAIDCQPLQAALSSPTGVQAAQVSGAPELTRLRELAGCLYAGPAAVHDLPEHWLDALLAASEGSPFSCDELLPYVAAAPNIGEMVNRFLGWKLPKDFHPDAGISFKPYTSAEFPEHSELYWPIGTNLLTADQARAMFEHCLAQPGNAAHGWEDSDGR